METALCVTLNSVKCFEQHCCLLDTVDSNYTLNEQ